MCTQSFAINRVSDVFFQIILTSKDCGWRLALQSHSVEPTKTLTQRVDAGAFGYQRVEAEVCTTSIACVETKRIGLTALSGWLAFRKRFHCFVSASRSSGRSRPVRSTTSASPGFISACNRSAMSLAVCTRLTMMATRCFRPSRIQFAARATPFFHKHIRVCLSRCFKANEFSRLHGLEPRLQDRVRQSCLALFTGKDGFPRNFRRRCCRQDCESEWSGDRPFCPCPTAIDLDVPQCLHERDRAMRLVEEDKAVVANKAGVDRGDALATAIAAEKQTRAELIDRATYDGRL